MTRPFDPKAYWEIVNADRKSPEYLQKFYGELRAGPPFPTKEHKDREWQLTWMKKKIHEHGWATILDAGCGPGFWFQLWHNLGLDATGVDQASLAKEKASHFASIIGAYTPVVCAPLDNLPFPHSSFNVAIIVKVLLQIPPQSIQACLRELGRVASNIMMIKMDSEKQLTTREHVFQHDFDKLFKGLNYKVVGAERHSRLEKSFIVSTR